MKDLTETTTVEFYTDNHEEVWVDYNNMKSMLLRNFIKLAKFDFGVAQVIRALSDKMKKIDFEGDLQDFLRTVFYRKNKTWDVFVPDGDPKKKDFGKVRFDVTELPEMEL